MSRIVAGDKAWVLHITPESNGRKRRRLLSRIVTGDKTWVLHITPESNQQSMGWKQAHSPVKVKARQTLSQLKIMVTIFRDRHGVLLVDFVQRATTNNIEACSESCADRFKTREVTSRQRELSFMTIQVLTLQVRPAIFGQF